jgi:putative ABC transport system permease protein
MAFTTDLRYALRSLRAHPFHAIVAAGSLAIGVSTVTGIVTLRDASRNLTPVFPNAERVVAFNRLNAGDAQFSYQGLQRATLARIASEAKGVSNLGVWSYTGGTLRLPDRFVSIGGLIVSGSVSRVLGVRPTLGRLFTDEDGLTGSAPIVVLSHTLWRTHFAGDSNVVGRAFVFNGVTHTVVGVLPRGAQLVEYAQFWTSRSLDRILADSALNLHAIATKVLGATPATITAEVRQLGVTEPTRRLRSRTRIDGAAPLSEMFAVQMRGRMGLLAMLGIIIGIIAATNFAVLILARGMQRHAELGIRAALGASVGGLARYLVLECAILGVVGGVGGAVLAPGVIAGIGTLATGFLPEWVQVSWTLPSLGAGVFLATVLGVVFGIAPILELARPAASGFLRGGTSAIAGNKRQAAGRRRLVATQIALATGTIVFIGVMFGSVMDMSLYDIAPNLNRVYAGRMAQVRYADSVWRDPLARASLLLAARNANGVVSSAVSHEYYLSRADVTALPGGTLAESDIRNIKWLRVSGDYFATVQPKLLYGRFPTAEEIARAEPVGVVSEGLRTGLGVSASTGWRVRLNPTRTDVTVTIVGVVSDLNASGEGRSTPTVFTGLAPAERTNAYSQQLWVQSNLGPRAAIPAITEALRRDAPTQTVVDMQSLAEMARSEVRAFRQLVIMAVIVFGLAIGLAALGVYGIITFGEMARRKEMAIRTALGGSRAHLAHVITRDATTQAIVGLALGIAGGVAAAAALVTRPVLFLIPPADVIGIAVASVAAVVVLSSIGPVRRVWRTDCADALRADG